MRVRTFIGILLAVLAAIAAAYLAHQNQALLAERFALSASQSIPLYAALIVVFLAGFLPVAAVLLVQTLNRDLAVRRRRRRHREAASLSAGFRRGVDYKIDGQWRKALAEMEFVLQQTPDDFATLMLYGELLRLLERPKEALEVHRRASVLYPHSVALLYELSEDYLALGQEEVAHEIRNRILRDFPGQGLRVLRRRRDGALAARIWEEAARLQREIEGLLRESNDEVGLNREAEIGRGLSYQLGVSLLEQEQVEEAARIFRQLLGEEPRFIPAAIMLGEAELLRDHEDGALSEWRSGYDNTGSPVFLQRIEDHFIEREEPVRAIETLRTLIATADNDLLPRFFLGRLYYRLEMHAEAQKVLQDVGDRIRCSPTYHYLLARIHERRGEIRLAAQSYLACAQELGVQNTGYRCQVCSRQYGDWCDRCEACGSWNSVDLNFQEEKLSPEDLGVRAIPAWGGYVGEVEELAPDDMEAESPGPIRS